MGMWRMYTDGLIVRRALLSRAIFGTRNMLMKNLLDTLCTKSRTHPGSLLPINLLRSVLQHLVYFPHCGIGELNCPIHQLSTSYNVRFSFTSEEAVKGGFLDT